MVSPNFCSQPPAPQASAADELSAGEDAGIAIAVILVVVAVIIAVLYVRGKNSGGEEELFPVDAEAGNSVERAKLIPRAVENTAYNDPYRSDNAADNVDYAAYSSESGN